jgi:hypothetical protein
MKTKKTTTEFITTLGIFLISAYLMLDGIFISKLNRNAFRLPRLVFCAIMVLCVIEMIRFFLYNLKAETKPKPVIKNVRNFLIGLAFLAGYCIALYFVGFIPSTIAVCLVFGFLFKYKRRILLIVYTIIATMLVWFVFGRILGVPLPVGLLFNWL